MINICSKCKHAKEDCMCPESIQSYIHRVRKKLAKNRTKGEYTKWKNKKV